MKISLLIFILCMNAHAESYLEKMMNDAVVTADKLEVELEKQNNGFRVENLNDGTYMQVSHAEVFGDGVDIRDLGNFDALSINVSTIMEYITDDPSVKNLGLISEFIKHKDCSTICMEMGISPFRYEMISSSNKFLNTKQVKFFDGKNETTYFIFSSSPTPIIAKVVKTDRAEIKIYYYKRTSNTRVKDYVAPESNLLAQDMEIDLGTSVGYDLNKGNIGVSFYDDGNSIKLETTTSKARVDSKVQLDRDFSFHMANEFDYEESLDSHQFYIETDGRRVIGVEYSNYISDAGKTEQRFRVSSEIYRKRTENIEADLLLEQQCDETGAKHCSSWVKFQLKF